MQLKKKQNLQIKKKTKTSVTDSLTTSSPMSQCVPNWNLDESPAAARFSRRPSSFATSQEPPILDYEVAELTWENGQLAMNAFGPPIKAQQMAAGATWPVKPGGNGTLECIVNQATEAYPSQKQLSEINDIGAWFDQGVVSASATLTMDALVPCGRSNHDKGASGATRRRINDPSVPGLGGGARMPGCSTRVASCSVQDEDAPVQRKKRVKEARVAAEWSGRTHSVSAGRDVSMDSLQMTADTGLQFTSTFMGSSDNTSSGLPCSKATTADDHDSVCHAGVGGGKKKRSGKSPVSTKRSRAAAIHNQSERKRRDKINQRMKILQKLVPNSSKTDKASVLDEAIDYLKQLQAQVQMVNRINMPPSAAAAAMMFPMAALQQQQQLQMSMMAPMMGMGMMPGVMDMNALAAARPGMPNLHGGATTASPFLPPMAATWDGGASVGDRNLHAAAAASSAAMMMDPMAAFLACQSQPMTLDTYSRMAAMYQQMAHQQQPPPPASNSKNLS